MLQKLCVVLPGLALALAGGIYLATKPAARSPFKEELGYDKQFAEVLGSRMAYIDSGPHASGRTFVFLHGNPTSSYLWRNVIPHLEEHCRCIAPDLIGMGDSDKLQPKEDEDLDERYSYVSHKRFLWAFMEEVKAMDVGKHVVLITHDWGSTIGFEWAAENEEWLAGIAFMEPVMPLGGSFGSTLGFMPKLAFQLAKSFLGEALVFKLNFQLNVVLPQSILRKLSAKEVEAYKAPFLAGGEERRAMLTWPRQVPLQCDPPAVCEAIQRNEEWLKQSEGVPKLWVNAEPGAIMPQVVKEFVRSLPGLVEVTMPGKHYFQEDHPDLIGEAIKEWQQHF